MSDANDMTTLHLTTIAFRMQCRVDVCLERNGGDEQAATTSSGIGISYGFAREITRTCECAAEQFAGANTELTSLRADIATYVQVSADQQGEIERLKNDNVSLNLELSKHTITVAGVGHRNQHLRAALAVCVAALDDAHNFVQAELDARIATHTIGGDFSTLDEADGGLCGEAMDCLERIGVARDAGKAALAKDV